MSATTAAAFVMISEFKPGAMTGASAGFVEIVNTGAASASLAGWSIDDIANGGASPHVFPAGTVLPAGARLVVSFAGINTSSADRVRLVDAGGHEIDGQSN